MREFDYTYMSHCAAQSTKGRLKERVKAHFEYTFMALIAAACKGYENSAHSYENDCLALAQMMFFTEMITEDEYTEITEVLIGAGYALCH